MNAAHVHAAVARAEGDGSKVVGLGGLTRTLYSRDDAQRLRSVKVVTGDTLAAAAVLHLLPADTEAVRVPGCRMCV
jgi:hypothetical protein